MRFLEDSKKELVQIIDFQYRGYYQAEHNVIFDDFYAYLQQAMLTGHSCNIGYEYSKLYFRVFLAVLEGLDLFDYLPDTDDFRACIYEYFLSKHEPNIHQQYTALTRSFNRTLYYLRALTTVEDFFQELMEVRLTPSCERALMQMTYCSQCAGHHASTFTCKGLCLNTLRGCFVDYSDLVQPLIEFAEAAVKMQVYLNENVNPFIHPFQHITIPIIEFLSNLTSDPRKIQEEVSIL